MKIFFLIFLLATLSHCDFSTQDQGGAQSSLSSEDEILQFIRELFQKNSEPIDESLIRDDV